MSAKNCQMLRGQLLNHHNMNKKKLGGSQFVKNHTQMAFFSQNEPSKQNLMGNGGVPLQHIVHMNFWVAFYISSPSTQYNTLVLCTCPGNWLWMRYQISCVRRKPKCNPKLMMDFPFNYLDKVNQMKHNLFQSQKITLNFWVRKK